MYTFILQYYLYPGRPNLTYTFLRVPLSTGFQTVTIRTSVECLTEIFSLNMILKISSKGFFTICSFVNDDVIFDFALGYDTTNK